MGYKMILTEIRGRVGLIKLNRPEARNALNNQLVHELMDALEEFDANPGIGAIVLTGSEKAFAAGADIKEMSEKSLTEMKASDFIQAFGRLTRIEKPVVGAVSGWALGGGFELALGCDMIVAAENAVFGQPEITIGVIPGAGGTQWLPRAVGKHLAMEMILNNRTLSAAEAMQLGIVNRVVSPERCLEEALVLASEIASRAPAAARAAKRMILQAFERPLGDGLDKERDAFHEVFDTPDRVEGMKAFAEKRKPVWKRP